MYIPDLTELPNLNPYSYEHVFPEDKNFRKLDDPIRFGAQKVIAIGWLGEDVKNTGDVPEPCIDRLFDAYNSEHIISDFTGGWHTCEICKGKGSWYRQDRLHPIIRWRGQEKELYGHGHHLILHGGVIYICPALILHYILHHGYLPPEQFINAVVQGEFILKDDYIKILIKELPWYSKLRWYLYKIRKSYLGLIKLLKRKRL